MGVHRFGVTFAPSPITQNHLKTAEQIRGKCIADPIQFLDSFFAPTQAATPATNPDRDRSLDPSPPSPLSSGDCPARTARPTRRRVGQEADRVGHRGAPPVAHTRRGARGAEVVRSPTWRHGSRLRSRRRWCRECPDRTLDEEHPTPELLVEVVRLDVWNKVDR